MIHLRRSQDDELEDLDLSSIQRVFSGAEPVRAETLARFSERFVRCGFDPSAFLPSYGFAE